MTSASLPLTLDNFQQVVLQDSKDKLLMIVFWAEQIPESVQLKSTLEAATANCKDIVVLASVDCQQQPQIAQQFGLKALPTIIVLKNGQPLDGISGPQTDEGLVQFLDKYLPKKQDTLLKKAQEALLANDVTTAYSCALEAYQLDHERADIKITLAHASVILGKLDDTEALLDTIKMVDQDSAYESVLAKLELAKQAANSPELVALEEAYQADPNNTELIHQLAAQYSQVNRNEDALNLLFCQVQSVKDDAKSKELLLDLLKALPNSDPLVGKFRRKLYTLMY